MAVITWDDVTNHAAELSTVSLGAQTDILAFVNSVLNVNDLGGEDSSMVKLLRVYLAAHFGTVDQSGGTGVAGPVTSESTGSISRSYAQLMGSDGEDTGTSYGNAYVRLVRMSPARAPIIL